MRDENNNDDSGYYGAPFRGTPCALTGRLDKDKGEVKIRVDFRSQPNTLSK